MSNNIDGHPAMTMAEVVSVVQLASILLVWLTFALGPATRARMLTACAAAVAAFIVFDRVLSPQYLIWLVPLVAMVPGRRGLVAMAMLGVAMCLTQIWSPLGWDELLRLAPVQSWAVVARDLVLLGLFGTLALANVSSVQLAIAQRRRARVAHAV